MKSGFILGIALVMLAGLVEGFGLGVAPSELEVNCEQNKTINRSILIFNPNPDISEVQVDLERHREWLENTKGFSIPGYTSKRIVLHLRPTKPGNYEDRVILKTRKAHFALGTYLPLRIHVRANQNQTKKSKPLIGWSITACIVVIGWLLHFSVHNTAQRNTR